MGGFPLINILVLCSPISLSHNKLQNDKQERIDPPKTRASVRIQESYNPSADIQPHDRSRGMQRQTRRNTNRLRQIGLHRVAESFRPPIAMPQQAHTARRIAPRTATMSDRMPRSCIGKLNSFRIQKPIVTMNLLLSQQCAKHPYQIQQTKQYRQSLDALFPVECPPRSTELFYQTA